MNYTCIIVGDKAVGKTSFIENLRTGNFQEGCRPTDSLETTSLKFPTNQGTTVTFQVYDGGYTFKPDCAIIMFDLTKKETLEHVIIHYQWIKSMFGEIPTVVCGNKLGKYDEKILSHVSHNEFNHVLQQHPKLIGFSVGVGSSNCYEPFQFLWKLFNSSPQIINSPSLYYHSLMHDSKLNFK